MANSVYERMSNDRPAIAERLLENTDVANVVLGLLARCIILSQERRLPLEGVEIGSMAREESANGDLTIRSKVTFHAVAMASAAMWPLQSDFAQYARAKAYGLGLALQKNPRFDFFFQTLVETLDQYSSQKNIPFAKLVVKQSIISNPGDIIVLKIGRKLLEH